MPEGLWPPLENPVKVEAFDLSVVDGAHPVYLANRGAIEADWAAEAAANPHLFDGDMVLQRRLVIDGGIIRGIAHIIPYSTFLWWRKQPEPADALHLFAFAVPVSSDGAIIAIRMSERTANPGQVYCAAGSLDRSDIVDGKLDLVANMRREVLEETGLDLGSAEAEPHFYAAHENSRIVVFRFYRFALTAEELGARIGAHMASEPHGEIDDVVVIRSAARDAHRYAPAMFPILDLYFGAGGG